MLDFKLSIAVCLLGTSKIFCHNQNSEFSKVLHRPIRSALPFTEASIWEIFVALAIPLEDPLKSVALSFFFEATYNLPNTTMPINTNENKKIKKKRSINRQSIYQTLENKLESHGYPGRACLLRLICETSSFDLDDNGIIGDLLNVIFKPSTSQPEDLPQDIVEAELVGRVVHNGTCSKYHSTCPMGLLDLIGIFV
ncbi:uncharacterized protein LOC122861209 [Aphidius gifuensis]|uniref:uncharacterized protein LOC122861209 n=1 Tax=Aphidius gifuensis TaxID=684658 RepID=UPI001CDD5CEF|nr:uncharacterized protein LOC122861209 [Aphidius gifuensis]